MSDADSISNSNAQNIDEGYETLNNIVDNHNRGGEANLAGQPPLQQARHVLQPFDSTISNHPVFRHPRITEVSVSQLEREDAIRLKLAFKYIDLQIIRVITAGSSTAGANTYSRRTNAQKEGVKFSRLLMCKVHSTLHPEQNSRLVYIMEARNMNQSL